MKGQTFRKYQAQDKVRKHISPTLDNMKLEHEGEILGLFAYARVYEVFLRDKPLETAKRRMTCQGFVAKGEKWLTGTNATIASKFSIHL